MPADVTRPSSRSGSSRCRGTSPTRRPSNGPAPGWTSCTTRPPSRRPGAARATTTGSTWSAPRTSIAACRRGGVGRLVHTSTPSVVFTGRDLEGVDESTPYPERYPTAYARTKAAAERAVVRAGATGALATICLRPHEIWGPGDPHFAPRIVARAARLRRIGDGRNLVDTTYIDNAAEAHVLAADRLRADPQLSGRVYFISQGEPVAVWDMIDAILKAAGRPPVRGRVSHRVARRLGWACEMVYAGLKLPGEPPMTRFVADALARHHWFDIGAARRDLGYTPRVSTAEGLERLAAWFTLNPIRT